MSALLLSADLMTSSQAEGAARRAGNSLLVVPNLERLLAAVAQSSPTLVIVDLSTAGAPAAEIAQALRASGSSAALVAFGPHVHQDRLEAAAVAGFRVLSRGQFHAGAEQLFRQPPAVE